MQRLPPDLRAEALRRLRRAARARPPIADPDPLERALDLRNWLKAACLDRYGWRVALDADRRLVAFIGRRRIDLEHARPPPASSVTSGKSR